MQYRHIDDQTLMLRFQESGDGEAFRTLFERHKDPLVAYLRRLSGRMDVAEDVSQQAWLKLLDGARRQAFAPSATASFRTYLFTLARNHFVDHYVRGHAATRTRPLNDASDRELPDTQAPRPEEAAAAGQLSAALDCALRELPLEQREVVALWSTGVAIDAIASIVGAPHDTVMSRKKYALVKLRSALARQGIEEA